MDALIMAAQLIAGLSLLVLVHEFGHFISAKAFGMKAEKFYLFFDAWGFKLFSTKIGGTEYGIGWLPLGGYVKIAGMIDESMDKEAMKKPPEPWEFRAKPAWQRLIVLLGGIIMNLILGVLIYSFILFHYADNYLPAENIKGGIYAHEMAEEIGLKTGDKIIAINGKPVERFKDIISLKVIFGATLTVVRNGDTLDVDVPDDFFKKVRKTGLATSFISLRDYDVVVEKVVSGTEAEKAGLQKGDTLMTIAGEKLERITQVPEIISGHKGEDVRLEVKRGDQLKTLSAYVDTSGTIGFFPKAAANYKMENYTFGKSLKFGFKDAFEDLYYNSIYSIGKIFTGEIKATESLQSPIGIARIYGATWDWKRFWYITGLISMVLAFMNLLPIPALDGGHVVFVLIEMVSGRKPNEKVMEYAQIVGIILLLALMVFVVGNDIIKIFNGK